MNKRAIRYNPASLKFIKSMVMFYNSSYGSSFSEADLDDAFQRGIQNFVKNKDATDFGTAGFHIYKSGEYTVNDTDYVLIHFMLDGDIILAHEKKELIDIPVSY